MNGGVAAEPRRFRSFNRVLNTSRWSAAANIPGHQPFTDNVQIGGAIVGRPPIRYVWSKKLAKFELQLVAHLNGTTFAAIMAALFVVVQIVDHFHGAVVTVLRDCADASVEPAVLDRKSTRLNSSHVAISYAVFCLKKKKLEQSN